MKGLDEKRVMGTWCGGKEENDKVDEYRRREEEEKGKKVMGKGGGEGKGESGKGKGVFDL